MLKITDSSDLALRKLKADEVVGGDGKADDRNLSKKLKNVKSGIQKRIEATKKPTFLNPVAKEAFT